MRKFLACLMSLFAIYVLTSTRAYAQSDMGSIRGYVKDAQGGVLAGVTVTAMGSEILAPIVGVTDGSGYYRLLNVPPGEVVVTAELDGFAVYRREGIIARAGQSFTVEIEMAVGTLNEVVTVKAESPMIETQKASTSFVISGELVRAAPITARAIFTDAIDMIPSVSSRQANDGSGVRVYYYMGSSQLSAFIALEGVQFGGYANPAPARTSMSVETIGDTELRTGGPEPSTPLTTGIYMNVIAPQGGNTFKGSVGSTLQLLAWNSDNSQGGKEPGGMSKPEGVIHLDTSLGGPIVHNKIWFFSSFRYADDTNGISRTESNLTQLETFKPEFKPFNNKWRTKNPFIKVTNQLNTTHSLSAYYIYDRSQYTSHREYDADQFTYQSGGGSLVTARLNSLWGKRVTSQISVAYNNKGNASEDTYKDLKGTGPQVIVHRDIFLSSGLATGTGLMVRMNNTQSKNFSPSSAVYVQGDVTYFKDGLIGSHEFKTGFYAAPRNRFDVTNEHVNDGFELQEVRQIDPATPAAGVVAFHERYITPSSIQTTKTRDRNIAIYVQDSWKPVSRLTASMGVRFDWVRRYDEIMGIERMNSANVGPRFGLSYLLTKDAKNVVRFSAGRVHDAVAGSDVITSFATTSPATTRDVYIDKNGNRTTVMTPPPTAALSALQFAEDLHQPFVDEFIVGYRRQFPYAVSLDFSARRRSFNDMYGLVDINGIYPSEPYQPFGGFGLVDPNRGILYQQRNNTWSTTVVEALELVLAKNLTRNLQAMVSLSRQWQHLEGEWNPTDPARFIQPDAFPNSRFLPATVGNTDNNSLNGGFSAFGGWRPYHYRAVGQYLAPWGITVAGSYEVSAGDYPGGPVFTRLVAPDPRFGPPRVTLVNGSTQANPLATTIRFVGATRNDGQVLNEQTATMQLKIGRNFRFGRNQFMASLNIFNLLNSGSFSAVADGANQTYNAAYLQGTSRIPARGLQITLVNRF